MKNKKIAATMLAAAVLAATPAAGTLSYAEIIANAGGEESVDSGVENAPKLIVDGKEIAPDSTYEGDRYGPLEADYSIKGNAAHTYKIEYKEGAVCKIYFECEDSETGADYSSEYYLCEFSTTVPITLSSSEKIKVMPEGVYGGAPLELQEMSGNIASLDEYDTLYSLGSQTGSGSFAFWGPSSSSTQISTTVMEFKSASDGTLEFTIKAKDDSESSSDSESSDVESSDVESSDIESSDVESSDVESSDVESSDVESSDTESSNKPVELKDDTTNISVSADKEVIPDGAALSVSAVTDKTDEKNYTYDISFKKDGKDVQPNGSVTVKIPVPEAIKDKTIYVYRVEDGKYTDMNAKVENGFVVFVTNHFSEYLLTAEKHEKAPESGSPDTGAAGISLTLGVIALAGAAVLVSRKKTR